MPATPVRGQPRSRRRSATAKTGQQERRGRWAAADEAGCAGAQRPPVPAAHPVTATLVCAHMGRATIAGRHDRRPVAARLGEALMALARLLVLSGMFAGLSAGGHFAATL